MVRRFPLDLRACLWYHDCVTSFMLATSVLPPIRPLAPPAGIFMTQYTQCELRRGQTQQVAFIPDHFAKRGAYLRIGEENGWRVEKVYGSMAGDDMRLLPPTRDARNLFGSI